MTDKRTQERAAESTTIKRPEDWTTGDEPMTGAQRSYLKTLSEEAGVEVDDDLTKAEASRRIDELQEVTGRGNGSSDDATRQGSAPRNRGDASRTTPGGRHNDRAEAVADQASDLPPGDRPLRHSSDSGDLD